MQKIRLLRLALPPYVSCVSKSNKSKKKIEMCNNFLHMYVMYYDLLEVVQYEIQSTGLKYELPLKSCRCIWYQIQTELPNRIPDTRRR